MGRTFRTHPLGVRRRLRSCCWRESKVIGGPFQVAHHRVGSTQPVPSSALMQFGTTEHFVVRGSRLSALVVVGQAVESGSTPFRLRRSAVRSHPVRPSIEHLSRRNACASGLQLLNTSICLSGNHHV
jgi:hypothetical protein